jgi:hypothetical protein
MEASLAEAKSAKKGGNFEHSGNILHTVGSGVTP